MLEIKFTDKTIFSFSGHNLCFLGKPNDFLSLAKAMSDLTGINLTLKVNDFDFVDFSQKVVTLLFVSKPDGRSLACFKSDDTIVFELSTRGWERLFKYFVFMSWDQCTYYLNSYENALDDLDLEQDCNFICSSEF